MPVPDTHVKFTSGGPHISKTYEGAVYKAVNVPIGDEVATATPITPRAIALGVAGSAAVATV
eukprot:2968451-Prymnesium_polylepis.1